MSDYSALSILLMSHDHWRTSKVDSEGEMIVESALQQPFKEKINSKQSSRNTA